MPVAKAPFRVTYGVVPGGHRGGGFSQVFSDTFSVARAKDSPYKYLVKVTCSQEKLFPLFAALTDFVDPDLLAAIDREIEDQYVIYDSSSQTKERMLEVFRDHEFQLINDGSVGFGIASRTFEVFVGIHKEINIHCRNTTEVLPIVRYYGMKKVRKLKWIGSGVHYHIPVGGVFSAELSRLMEPPPEEERRKYESDPEAYDSFCEDIVEKLEMVERKRTRITE